MLGDDTTRPLLAQGWRREHDALTWSSEHGTSMRCELTDRLARITVNFDSQLALAYEISVEPNRLKELLAALAEATSDLNHLHHASFSKAVARLASDAVVRTTEGYLIRPRIVNDDLVWEPLDS